MPLPQAVQSYFDRLSGPMKEIVEELARIVPSRGPGLIATVAWGAPCWSGNERVISVIAHAHHCNLQLWSGARLAADFCGRIEGSGKALRHVKVRDLSEIDDELIDIIDCAIALDQSSPQRVR
ncbi:DUF1801 domain-containing protein [Henriciella marina]|uniref:DUF1801 domain-containing protein n=1 Tax=Henriciella marina TaxID=453851 RepID=UPI0003609288|nr:DUF1801 domain-containing protein [Henriciella marina]